MTDIITKCVFPAAGYGTRFLPATKSIPKEMLPVVNKPLIHYGVEEAVEAGIEEMCIVNGRNKEAITNYFDIQYELEDRLRGTKREAMLDSIRAIMKKSVFTYVRQKSMRGLGDAILTSKPLIDEHPFAVLLADDLCINPSQGVLSQMIQLYKRHQCPIVAVEEVADDVLSNYGVITGKPIDERLTLVDSMVEKPERHQVDTNLAIIGRYILTPDIFPVLQSMVPGEGGEVQITDAINVLAQKGRVLAYQFEGIRFDCGRVEGMVQATEHVYRNMR